MHTPCLSNTRALVAQKFSTKVQLPFKNGLQEEWMGTEPLQLDNNWRQVSMLQPLHIHLPSDLTGDHLLVHCFALQCDV